MKVIVTGATGMVGEGVLLECLENPAIAEVLSVSRRAVGEDASEAEGGDCAGLFPSGRGGGEAQRV